MIMETKKVREGALEEEECSRKDDCHHIDEKFATRSCVALAADSWREVGG